MTRPPRKNTPHKAPAGTPPSRRRPAAGSATGAQQKTPAQQKTGVQQKTGGDRIAKVIARAGRASRREAEALIAEGRVTVNGKRIDSPALNVTPRDTVAVDNQVLGPPDPPRLWLYHKPTGLVTTMRDEKGRQTVFESLPPDMPRVVSIGRLDLNSEGLLLLTNDGELKRRLELPETGWLRKYRVRAHGTPDDTMLAPLRDGITIEGERFQPMMISIDRQQGANAWLSIGIREGRNREIRRALEAVGLGVNRLIRTGYGPFQLGTLKPGEVQEIRPSVLRDQLGIDLPAPPGRVSANATPRPATQKPGKSVSRQAEGKPSRQRMPDNSARSSFSERGTKPADSRAEPRAAHRPADRPKRRP